MLSGVAFAYGPGCDAVTHKDPAATGIVPCGVSKDATGVLTCPCEIPHFFIMIRNVYIFVTWTIALPLAGLLIVIGGVLLIISGANQNMFDLGKRLLWGAFWGVVLVFCAWIIINIIFMTLGINMNPGAIFFT